MLTWQGNVHHGLHYSHLFLFSCPQCLALDFLASAAPLDSCLRELLIDFFALPFLPYRLLHWTLGPLSAVPLILSA